MASSNLKSPDGATPPIQCYLQCVSPIKKSGSCTYFNCDLQTESGITQAVCFAPERKTAFDSLAQQKSPVKIRKYKFSTKFGRKDVQLSKWTDVQPLTELQFEYKKEDIVLTVSSLARVTPGQLVTIKGKVVHVSGCKKLTVMSGTVDKQECNVVDPSGNIKIILWGKYANGVQEGNTYQFIKFRLKKSGQELFLNTPIDEDGCMLEDAEDFNEPLPQVDDVNLSNYKDKVVEVLGVQNLMRTSVCSACKRKVNLSSNGLLAHCTNGSCNLTQKASKCKNQWSLELVVESENDNLQLTAFHVMVKKLLALASTDIEALTSNEQVEEAILSLDKLHVSYDVNTRHLQDAELV